MKTKQQLTGQTLVEFAFIIPIALLLILGFFDLGRAVFYYSSISNSVREGTRHAIVGNNYASVEQFIKDKSFGIQDTDLEIEITPISNEDISITVKYLYVPITPFIAQILGNAEGIELVAQSTMRISGAFR